MSAPPPQNCCGPCSGVGYCRTDVNCCIECHMSWEEEHCGPYLPPEVYAKLQAEHARLAKAGFPPAQLIAHSVWEDAVYKKYCPPELVRQVKIDHSEYEQGRMRSRAAVMR